VGLVLSRPYWPSSISSADPGELTEPDLTLPPDVPVTRFVDATDAWRLARVDVGADVDAPAGGVAVADMDNDGDLDLVVANGRVAIIPWENDSYGEPTDLGIDGAVGVTATDVDGDGWIDALVARRAHEDVVVWGGESGRTSLPGGSRSSGLIAADLGGDARLDILRLGFGEDGQGEPDVIWIAEADRSFVRTELPASDRPSLAAELVDIDEDGLLDIWITRDVGWAIGADSLFSRRGDRAGAWVDVAPELGTALEVDGMGITVADLDADGSLDAYVSDLGDNEVLVYRDGSFEQLDGTGAARVRPPGAVQSVVSSSWASGAADFNLDGRLDLAVANGGFPGRDVANKIPGTEIAVNEAPAVFIGDGSGRFVDMWTSFGIDVSFVARGMSVADLDGDGDDDIVVMGSSGVLRAFRNDAVGSSLAVRLGPRCRVAGAVVDVRRGDVTFRTLIAPNSYAGAHGTEAIIGTLGSPVDVTVEIPGERAVPRAIAAIEQRNIETFDC
jgi:hypothetical protein